MLGANDGLVSNLSLVMGVAGASVPGKTILLTGLAGLVAGACSMAMGEWLSVTSARELNQKQIAIEADELARMPEEEMEEMVLIYQAKGLDEPTARISRREIDGEQGHLRSTPWRARNWASTRTSSAARPGWRARPRSACSPPARSFRWRRFYGRAARRRCL